MPMTVRPRSRLPPPKVRQRGQALVYGIFMLTISLTGLFFLFNTGQLASEKTKLVNTADAVAYSGGVMHARALNFDAYTNRALMANEVLVAQMVSLSSWVQYARTYVQDVVPEFPACATVYTVGTELLNYDAAYAIRCFAIANTDGLAVAAVDTLADSVPTLAEGVVTAVELNKTAIESAQALLHAPAYFNALRTQVMQQVADRNYADDGSVTVRTLAPPQTGADGKPVFGWDTMTSKYEDGDRQRFADVAAIAAASDKFVPQRAWVSEAVAPSLSPLCFLKKNSVKRSGGTNLVGLDEWKAEDTQSFWYWHTSGGLFKHCSESEAPIAWGEQHAAPSNSTQNDAGAVLGGSPTTNPAAHSLASSSAWSEYSGIPAFYELSADALKSDDPRLSFAVKLERAAASTRTSAGASSIKPSEHLNKFANNFAGGVMSAVATSEVYFERPWFNTGDDSYSTGVHTDVVTQNQYEVKTEPKSHELGSLFNPYWHVRLAATDAATLAGAQAGAAP